MHYYSEMSAMGDIPLDSPTSPGRIANVSIPLCILHALDDPLITWKTVAANDGLRHPSNVVKSGSGNVLMLLTKAGGHVGWPLGVNPAVEKWGWMNGAVQSYTDAFEAARKEQELE
jgi:predicted alpha/beta-fold hydrolase